MMMTWKTTVHALIGWIILAVTHASAPLRSSRVLANLADEPPSHVFVCRILLFDIMTLGTTTDFFMCNPIEDGEVSSQRYPIDLPADIAKAHAEMVSSAATSAHSLEDFYIGIPYGYIDPVHLEIVIPDPWGVTVLETSHRRRLARSVTSKGTYTALVLRIVDKNGRAPVHSFDELYEAIFDTQGVSLHSQYLGCSWGQFKINPAGGVGVIEVKVDRDSTDGDARQLTQAAEKEALKMLGESNLFDYTDFM